MPSARLRTVTIALHVRHVRKASLTRLTITKSSCDGQPPNVSQCDVDAMTATRSARRTAHLPARRAGSGLLAILLAAGLAGVTFELSDEGAELTQARTKDGRGPGFTYAQDTHITGPTAVIVTSIERGSLAEQHDIRAGDIIDQIDGRPVISAARLEDALLHAPSAGISLRLRRDGRYIERTLPAGALAGKP